jgi:CRISP-associated protein Cas1
MIPTTHLLTYSPTHHSPTMMTLYVKEQGAMVRRTHRRLVVQKGDRVLATVRLRELERLVLLGNVEVTASALAALLEEGTETVLLSLGGRYRGRLAPAEAKNVFLRQAQFRRCDDMEFRLGVARTIIEAKIRNTRAVLQRHQRNYPHPALALAVERLERCREKVAGQSALDPLLGVEGEAARIYFGALGTMVRAEFAFTTRTRRPPRDPVNALLSFGYTLLTTELTGALAAHGLDPYVGILHELDYGRPSLALDLMEEFRQPVIDRLALSLVNLGVLKAEHFENRGEAGVFLNDAGRPRFLEFYDRALTGEFEDRSSGVRTSFRELLCRQAGRIRQVIVAGTDYEPYAAR